jgi:hypothetical protein
MNDKLSLWDNTRLSAAKTCMRYFMYRHVYHLTPDEIAPPLVFGSAWGCALDVIWLRNREIYVSKATRRDAIDAAYAAFTESWTTHGFMHPDDLSPDDIDRLGARTPMTALDMIHDYVDVRQQLFMDKGFSLISIENPFIVPLDPNDPHKWYVGRIDKVFALHKDIYGSDHKTTVMYAKKGIFRSPWIDAWSLNSQIDGYNYVLRIEYGERARGVWVDGALVHKTVHDGFKFIPVERQQQQLDAWLWEAHSWIDDIEANLAVLEERSDPAAPYLAAFPKNTNSCVQYERTCPYFELCQMYANPTKLRDNPPIGFKIHKWQPFDELKLAQLGLANPEKERDSENATAPTAITAPERAP